MLVYFAYGTRYSVENEDPTESSSTFFDRELNSVRQIFNRKSKSEYETIDGEKPKEEMVGHTNQLATAETVSASEDISTAKNS